MEIVRKREFRRNEPISRRIMCGRAERELSRSVEQLRPPCISVPRRKFGKARNASEPKHCVISRTIRLVCTYIQDLVVAIKRLPLPMRTVVDSRPQTSCLFGERNIGREIQKLRVR